VQAPESAWTASRRRREAEAALEPDLTGRRRDQVGAAHDVGNALKFIVDRNSQLIGVQTVCPAQHEVADITLEILRLPPLQTIDKGCLRVADPEPPGPYGAPVRQTVAAGSGIGQPAIDRRARRRVANFLARAGAAIGQSGRLELFKRRAIGCETPALPEHFAIPLEAEALQRSQDVFRRARDIARRIDILHTHQPLAADAAGVEIAADRRDQRPEMQGSGGRRGKTAAITGGFFRHDNSPGQSVEPRRDHHT
jgi:hypothetical protein